LIWKIISKETLQYCSSFSKFQQQQKTDRGVKHLQLLINSDQFKKKS